VVQNLFRFLFKYPPLLFQQGDFSWGLSRPVLLVVARGDRARGPRAPHLPRRPDHRSHARPGRARRPPAGGVAVLLFCLFRPTLILKAAVPQQNFLGILIDDSRSMSIADRDGQPRSAFIQQQLTARTRSCSRRCRRRFVVRFFRFSSSSDRVASAGDLKFGGTSTRLAPALDRARDELAGLAARRLVMVTDGADTSDAAIDETLASLKARSIPVFTVGVGQERFAHDVRSPVWKHRAPS
jgi:hypothetical protein